MNASPAPRLSAVVQGLFGGDEALTRALLEELSLEALDAGRTLFHQGEVADAAYLIVSGRLRVVLEGEGEESILNEIGPGELFGEMALLTDDARSATVYAVRDSRLARLGRESFLRILRHHPGFLSHLTGTLVRRLRRWGPQGTPHSSTPTSIALVPLDGEIEALTQDLAAALEAFGPVVKLDGPSVRQRFESIEAPGLASWLTEQEEAARFTLYRADREWTPWTELCARQADRILLIGSAAASPEPGSLETKLQERWSSGRSPKRTLLLIRETDAPPDTRSWLDARNVDEHFHLRSGEPEDVQRLARILAGRAVGLVLGGGGARGLAHIGVIRALEEVGIPIDFLGGTSIGATIAAMLALEGEWAGVKRSWERSFVAATDYTWPAVALTSGRKLNRSIWTALGGHRLEDLRTTTFALSTNLSRAEPRVSRRGDLAEEVRASVSLPGIFPPCLSEEGDYLVDGGLLNNVPVDVMRDLVGDGTVIAVEVTGAGDLEADARICREASGWRLLLEKLTPWTERRTSPSMMTLLLRSTLVGSVAARNEIRQQADLYLELPMEGFSLLQFEELEALVERGYVGALKPVQEWWQARGGGVSEQEEI
ncbi:MAG: cyclic nucleotide-binding and patatin-like phospholipase domain-containing protein [Planctomycetota bacterium]